MQLSEYVQCDATELATLLASGEVTAADLQACAYKAIEAVNPAIACVVETFAEPEKASIKGSFAGVPFLAKDAILHIAGRTQKMGCRALERLGIVDEESSTLYKRFQDAGLVTLGLTSTPEFAFNAACEAVVYGPPTRNPFAPGRSPGGSSGGAAAAVAAGIVPMAHANDGGGSTRIPAANCGLIGLKPSRGRTPIGPHYGLPLFGMGIEFAVTRSVRDAAKLLDAVEGPDVGDMFEVARPTRPYSEIIQAPTRPLKLAVATELPGTAPCAPFIKAAVADTARFFEEAGHTIVDASPDFNPEVFHDANFLAWSAFCASGLDAICQAPGIEATEDFFEAVSLKVAEAGRSASADRILGVFDVMNTVSRSFGRFMADYDALILPMRCDHPQPIGLMDQNDPNQTARGFYDQIFGLYAFTAFFNMTGQPAITAPVGQHEGIPVPVQIAGPMGREDTLLQLVRDLEEAGKTKLAPPQVWAGRV